MTKRHPNADFLKKEPSPTHKAVAEYVTKTTGHAVSEGDVALVQRLYPMYLKSDEVTKAREAEEAKRREAAEAKAKEKADRLKARLAEAEAKTKDLRRQLGLDTDDEAGPDATLGDDEAGLDALTHDADVPTEPVVVTLGDDTASDEFVETEPDDDDWGDDNDEAEDF